MCVELRKNSKLVVCNREKVEKMSQPSGQTTGQPPNRLNEIYIPRHHSYNNYYPNSTYQGNNIRQRPQNTTNEYNLDSVIYDGLINTEHRMFILKVDLQLSELLKSK